MELQQKNLKRIAPLNSTNEIIDLKDSDSGTITLTTEGVNESLVLFSEVDQFKAFLDGMNLYYVPESTTYMLNSDFGEPKKLKQKPLKIPPGHSLLHPAFVLTLHLI